MSQTDSGERLTAKGNTAFVEFEEGIAWVTMNRPEKRNAMNPALNDDMCEILDTLERVSLDGWRTRTLALPQLFAHARAAADKLVEPKIRHVKLPAATLRTPEDVAAWIDRTNQDLLNQIRQGPIAIG